MPISNRLSTKIRLTMLCLSGFELYSRWVPQRNETDFIAFSIKHFNIRLIFRYALLLDGLFRYLYA